MDELQDVLKQHAMIMKATTALFYGILVSIAMNFFWEPGHIYSSGITGLAQLIGTLTKNGPVHLSTALMLFVLNIPLFVLGWRQSSAFNERPDHLRNFWRNDQWVRNRLGA